MRYPDVRVLPDIRESIEIDGLEEAVRALPAPERYLSVLARNACHFAPFSWYRWQSFHLRARQLIAEASEAATEPTSAAVAVHRAGAVQRATPITFCRIPSPPVIW